MRARPWSGRAPEKWKKTKGTTLAPSGTCKADTRDACMRREQKTGSDFMCTSSHLPTPPQPTWPALPPAQAGDSVPGKRSCPVPTARSPGSASLGAAAAAALCPGEGEVGQNSVGSSAAERWPGPRHHLGWTMAAPAGPQAEGTRGSDYVSMLLRTPGRRLRAPTKLLPTQE